MSNPLLCIVTLNAFSSPTTNYGFFVSQASTFLYTVQAAVMSAFLLWKQPQQPPSLSPKKTKAPGAVAHRVYVYMGVLDAGSATLGAIAGAYCPGELQTILNQMIIPVTLIGSFVLLHSRFKSYQLWGSVCIVFGTVVASSDYFLGTSRSQRDSPQGGMTVAAAIVIYFLSVLPSAFSNIYKEKQMKLNDMNEVHTSTLVSFWQLWIGFLFLPLLSLPSLGGLSWEDMATQMSDGYSCFLGTNPKDPHE